MLLGEITPTPIKACINQSITVKACCACKDISPISKNSCVPMGAKLSVNLKPSRTRKLCACFAPIQRGIVRTARNGTAPGTGHRTPGTGHRAQDRLSTDTWNMAQHRAQGIRHRTVTGSAQTHGTWHSTGHRASGNMAQHRAQGTGHRAPGTGL